MPVAIDYVTKGVERWPEKTRFKKTMRYFTVYLESIQGNETEIVKLLNAFANWYRPGLSLSFVLDIVGGFFLKQARPASFDDENYRVLLIARTLVRVSQATEADVQRVVDYLSRINGGFGNYSATSSTPEHWTIDIFDVVLTPQWLELYTRLIFDTIGAVDSFTLRIGINGSAVYNDNDSVYNDALYS